MSVEQAFRKARLEEVMTGRRPLWLTCLVATQGPSPVRAEAAGGEEGATVKARIHGDWEDGEGWRDVTGRKVGPFIVHRAIEPHLKRKPVWRVTLLSTGLYLPADLRSERAALLAARRVIRLGFNWHVSEAQILKWPREKRQRVKDAVQLRAPGA